MSVPCSHCTSDNVEKRGQRAGKQRYLCYDCDKWFSIDLSPKRRRLFLDIETSPNIGLFWSPGRKISIGYENIIKERAIICLAWKWAGKDQVKALTWDENQSDKKMLEEFIPVLAEADEIVAHNGDRFDVTWIRTRALLHGIPMEPNIVSQDTLKLAKSKFRFNSNKLDYIASFLGLGSKVPTTYGLWKDVLLNKDPKAMKMMVEYCKNDVVLLESIWDKLMPFVPAKTSVATIISSCPECGSNHTIINKQRITAHGYKKITFVCKDCGKYHTVAASRFTKAKEQAA